MNDYITLDKREQRLLKAYMTHHSWSDLLVTYPNESSFLKEDSEQVKKYGSLKEKFKMTASEIDTFRSKLGI